MNDYIGLYLNSTLSTGTPETFLTLFLLGLARLLPIIQMSPFFGSRTLPLPVKVGFGITLFFILFPSIIAQIKAPMGFSTVFLLMVFKEAFIGWSLGWLMSSPFSIVQTVGMVIDHQRGGASLMVNDPTIQNQSSPLGTLFNLVLITVFYTVGGPFYFIEAINTSYEIIPPDSFLNPLFFTDATKFWQIQITLLNKIMKLAIQMAAPGLITILMTDMFLGIANRLAPQVQIIFLGLPLKSLLALLVIWLGWNTYNEYTVTMLFNWFSIVKEAMFSLSLQSV